MEKTREGANYNTYWVSQNSLTLAAGVSDSLRDRLRQALADGLAANETIPEMADRLATELDAVNTITFDPILDDEGNIIRAGGTREISAAVSSEMIARTEANRAFNKGNLDALEQGGVEQVQWLLASDACPECVDAADAGEGAELGKIIDIGEAGDELPVHPNCRCTFIAPTEEGT